MVNKITSKDETGSNLNQVISQLGFYSSVLTAIIAAVFFIAGILTPARSGPFAPAANSIIYLILMWQLLFPTIIYGFIREFFWR